MAGRIRFGDQSVIYFFVAFAILQKNFSNSCLTISWVATTSKKAFINAKREIKSTFILSLLNLQQTRFTD